MACHSKLQEPRSNLQRNIKRQIRNSKLQVARLSLVDLMFGASLDLEAGTMRPSGNRVRAGLQMRWGDAHSPSPIRWEGWGEGELLLPLRLCLNSKIGNRLAGGRRKTDTPLPITPAFVEDFEDHNINTLFEGNVIGHVSVLFEWARFRRFQQ